MDKRRKIHDFQEFKGRASIFQEYSKNGTKSTLLKKKYRIETSRLPRVTPHTINEKNEERVNKSVI
mgnify:CR=1 FL=1